MAAVTKQKYEVLGVRTGVEVDGKLYLTGDTFTGPKSACQWLEDAGYIKKVQAAKAKGGEG
jgi:hypothetical protein